MMAKNNIYRKKDGDNRSMLLFVGISMAMGCLGLLGYFPGLRLLASIHRGYIPMAFSTAIFFILFGLIYIFFEKFSQSRLYLISGIIFSVIVSCFGLAKFIEYIISKDASFELYFVNIHEKLGEVPVGIMSHSTGLVFFFAGIALFFYLLSRASKAGAGLSIFVSGLNAGIVFLSGLIFILGYFYNHPFLYGRGSVVPMAFTTAIAFCCLGFGQLYSISGRYPLAILIGSDVRALLIRSSLPSIGVISITYILHDIIEHVFNINDAILASSFTVISTIVVAVIVVRMSFLVNSELENLAKFPAEDPNPVLRIKKSGEIIYANKSAGAMLSSWGSRINSLAPEKWQNLIQKAFNGMAVEYSEEIVGENIFSFTITPFVDRGYCNLYANDITERKKAEDALRNSEHRFRELFNNMDTCVAIYEAKNDGSDFIFKDFNKAAERVEKIKKEALIGKSVLEVFPGVREFGLFEVFQKAWKTGKPQVHPVTLYKDKRITGWKENYVYKLPGGEIVAIYSDVTARKQIEESLKQSYSLLSATLESTADGILVVDVQGRVSSFNQKFLELWRIPKIIADRMDDQQLLKFVLDQLEDPAAFLARVQELYKSPQDSSWEELRFRDGRVFERYSQPQHLGDAVVGRVWSFRNITERKKIEAALQKSEQEKRMVLDRVSELIVYQDTQNNILWANKAAAESAGLTTDQIIGRKCYEVWHRRSEPCLVCAARKCLVTGKFESSEIQTQDGKFWQVNANPLKEGDNVIGVIETTIDITERKKTENGLRRDKKKIEKQLDDSRRLADIGTLAATVAHELRNPLGVIGTASYNLRVKIGDNENLIKHIKNIEKKIAESDQIINNLLSYSRLKMPDYAKLNVSSVLDDCLASCLNKYAGYGVEVKTIYGNCPKDLLIDADPAHIAALFSNILDNAYQAFNDKKGRIVISIDCDKKKDTLNIVFADNGCGMEEAELDKAFEPFFTTRSRGMGLGLSVCRQVINLHSGAIDIKSKKGEGTSVYVSLPLRAKL